MQIFLCLCNIYLIETLIFLLWLSKASSAQSGLIITYPAKLSQNIELENLFSPQNLTFPSSSVLFLKINSPLSKHPISVETINQNYCWVPSPKTFPKNNLPRAIFYGKRCFIAKRGKHVFAEMGNSTRPTNPINDMNGTIAHPRNYQQHHPLLKAYTQNW